jgi:hypothetical protein
MTGTMIFPAMVPDSSIVATMNFLNHVLPLDGWLVAIGRKHGHPTRQEAIATVEQLVNLALQWDAVGFECYHAVASFAQQRVWNPKKQNRKTGQLGGWSIRTHENVRTVASLIADIDTKLSHPDSAKYADQIEAYLAMVAFCLAVGIPLPVFVSSGGGLHCYWPLDTELTREEWEPLAQALKAAFEHHGVAADPSRTADASSILRTPGTHHHKTGRVVEAGELAGPYPLKLFDPIKKFAPKAPRRRPKAAQDAATSVLGQMWADEPTDPEKIVRQCRQLAVLKANINGPDEPIHHAAAGVFARCKPNGREYFKQMSRGYRGLPAANTDAWCEAAMDRNVAATTGPTTCKRFRDLTPPGQPGCNGCPYWGEITSPIILGRRLVPLVLPHKPPVVLK